MQERYAQFYKMQYLISIILLIALFSCKTQPKDSKFAIPEKLDVSTYENFNNHFNCQDYILDSSIVTFDKNKRYNLRHPFDWEIQTEFTVELDAIVARIALMDSIDSSYIGTQSMTVFYDPASISDLDYYLSMGKINLEKDTLSALKVEKYGNGRFNNEPCTWLTYSETLNNIKSKSLQIYLQTKDKKHILTYEFNTLNDPDWRINICWMMQYQLLKVHNNAYN